MKQKILFITAFVPNEEAAGEKNSMLMIKDLSRSYDVDLIYYKYKNQNLYKPVAENIKVIRVLKNSTAIKICNAILLPFLYPVFTIRFNFKVLFWLKQIIKNGNYKAIIFEHSQMLLYAKFIKTNAIKILFSQDVMYQRISRTSGKFLSHFCKLTEAFCLNTKNSYSFAISKKDADLIKTIYRINALYSVAYIDEKIIKVYPQKINNEFVFIGKWTRADNLDGVIWFFNNVIPLITSKIKITILGKNFPKEKISNNNTKVEVNIPGFIEDPYPIIANCKAMLSPLFTGAGVKQKVLESLACGTPIIGTPIAFEGISDKYKDFMILAKNAKEYFSALKIDIPIEKRIQMKDKFIKEYSSETIPKFLNHIINSN